MFRYTQLLFVGFMAVSTLAVRSATITWTNLGGGNWNATNNWSPNQVPGATDTALITTPGSYTVILNVAAKVTSLTVGSAITLQDNANALTATNATINGTLGVTNTTVAGAFTINGTLIESGCTFNGAMTIPSGGVMDEFGSETLGVTGSLTVAGGFLNLTSSTFSLFGPLTNNVGTINLTNSVIYIYNNNNTNSEEGGVINNGMIHFYGSSGDDILTGGGGFDYMTNQGTVDVVSGTGTSKIACTAGVLQGDYVAAAGTTLQFSGGTAVAPLTPSGGVALNSPGQFVFVSGYLYLPTDVIPNLVLQAGTLSLGPSFQQNGAISSLTLDGMTLAAGNYVVNGTMVTTNSEMDGNVLVAGGGVLNMYASETLGVTGSLTVASGGVLNMGGASLYLYAPLTNNSQGVINMTNAAFQIYNNNTTNSREGGIINNGAINFYGSSGDGIEIYSGNYNYFTNYGTVVQQPGTGTSTINVNFFANLGTINDLAGTLNMDSMTGSLGGTYNAVAGATVNFTGTVTQNDALVLGGVGAYRFVGGTLTLTNDIIPSLQLTGGTLVLGTNFQENGAITNLVLNGTTLAASNYVVNGTLVVTNSEIDANLMVAGGGVVDLYGGDTWGVTGSLTVASGGVLNMGGASLYLYAPLTNNSQGVINMTNAVFEIYNNNTANSREGGIINSGFVNFYGSSGDGIYNYSGTYNYLTNYGTVVQQPGTGTSTINVDFFANLGTINDLAGTLTMDSLTGSLSGTYNAAAGATVNFSGTVTQNDALVLGGLGGYRFVSGTLTLTNDVIPGLLLTGGTVALGTNFQENGAITNLVLDGATLAASNYVVNGTLVATNSEIDANLTVAGGGVVDLYGGDTWGVTGSLTVASGGVLNMGGASLYLYAPLTNNSQGVINMTNAVFEIYNNNTANSREGGIINSGFVNFYGSSGDGIYNYSGTYNYLTNYGTVVQQPGTGTSTINVDFFANLGTINDLAGTLTMDSLTGSLSGTYNAAAGATVNFSGTVTQNDALVLGGLGGYRFVSGTLTLTNDVIPGLLLTGGTVALGTNFQENGAITNLVLDGTTLAASNYVVNGTLVATNSEIDANLMVAGGGVLDLYGGDTWGVTGSLTVAGGGMLNMLSSYLYLYAPLTNTTEGVINMTNAVIYVYNNNTPNSREGGIINSGFVNFYGSSGDGIYNYSGTYNYLTNYGTVVQQPGTGTSTINVDFFANLGTINDLAGTLIMESLTGSLGGTYNAAAGATVNFSGTVTQNDALVLGGLGGYRFVSGTLTLTNDVIPGLLLTGGTVALGTNFQENGAITNLVLDGTTLAASNYVVNGTLVATNSEIDANLTVAGGGALDLYGGDTWGVTGSLTVAGGGMLNMLSSYLYLYAPLTNSSQGVINMTNAEFYIYNNNAANSREGGIINSGVVNFYGSSGDGIYNYGGTYNYLTNYGTVVQQPGTGTSTINVDFFANPGTINDLAGTLNITEVAGDLAGNYNSTAGATVNFSGTTTQDPAWALSGLGVYRFVGGALTLTNNPIPSLQLTGGTLVLGPNFQQNGAITNLTLDGITLAASNYVVNGTLAATNSEIDANLAVAAGGTLIESGCDFTGTVNVTGGGVLSAYGDTTLNVTGSLTVAGEGVMNMGGYMFVYGPLTNSNQGVINMTNAEFYLYNNNVTNSREGGIINSGTLNFYGASGDAIYNYGGNYNYFTNFGTVVQEIGAGSSAISVDYFANLGTINDLAATLNITSVTGSVAGVYNAAAGTTVNFSGTITQDPSWVLGGLGLYQFVNGTLTLTNDVIPGLQLTGGTLVLGSNFQQNGAITNLALDGITLAASNYVVNGLLVATNSEIDATLTVAGGGVLDLYGGTTMNVTGSLTVAGGGVLNIGGGCYFYLYAPLTNSSQGLINMTNSLIYIYNNNLANSRYGGIINFGAINFYGSSGDEIYNYGGNYNYFTNYGTVTQQRGAGTSVISVNYFASPGTLSSLHGLMSLNNVTLQPTSVLNIGLNSAADAGRFSLAANAALNGTLSVALDNSYVPATGASFTVLSYPSFTGNFSGTNLPPAETWTLSYNSTALTLLATKGGLQPSATITWANPGGIVYGTSLGANQLNASANTAGTFVYSPPLGTVLSAGNAQTLNVTFTPSDPTSFSTTFASVMINVVPATPIVTWSKPADIVVGTPLSSAQLDATASVPGTFVYIPPAGTLLAAGSNQTLSFVFTPTDSTDYTSQSASVLLNVISATSTAVCVPPPSGILSWWPGNGNALDIVGTNNGTISGNVTFTNGLVNEAFDFDGSGGYVETPPVTLGLPEGTVEFWFNVNTWDWNSPNSSGGIYFWAGTEYLPSLGSFDGINLGNHQAYTSTGELMFGIFSSDWNWAHSGVVPQTNTWYHVAGTWGSGGVRIYVNGVLKATNSYTGPAPNYTTYDLIGRSSWAGSGIDGLVDEVSIYSRALSASEIAGIYNAGSAGKCGITLPIIPVAGPNLLTNGDFSGGDNGFSSDYTFVASGPTSATGQFAVRSNATNFSASFASFGDHTTDAGLMLLATGSSTANQAVWFETVLVATNTDYLFNFWGASCETNSPAVLSVQISGTQAGPTSAFPTTSGQWQQYQATWNSGTNTSATFALVDQNLAASGNDFTLDDLSLTALIGANIAPLSQSVQCGGNATFTATGSGAPPLTYQWWENDGAGFYSLTDQTNSTLLLSSLSTSQSGSQYYVAVANSFSMVTSQVATLLVYDPAPPTMTLLGSPAVTIVQGTSFADQGAIAFGSCGESIPVVESDNINLNIPGVYTASYVATTVNGLSTTNTRTVTVIQPAQSCVSAPAGLAGWWPGNGSAVDEAGGDLGYLEGGAGYGPGLAGEAFAFAGGGQGVLLPYELGTDLSALSGYGAPNGRGAAGWTVEGWVRPALNNHAEYPTIYSYGYWGASLGLESGTGVLESWINDDNVLDGSIVVPVGQWSHVAVTYDGTNRTLYVNGLAAGADQPGELAGPAYVGSAIGNVAPLEAESGFDGEIGGISVYGRGLTGGEIASIYRAGSLGKCVIYGEPAVGLFTPAGGGAGTLVRLSGSGFLLTTNVTFNGRAADFAVESDGALAAYAPAGVATGPIGVEGGAGAVVTARSFTVAAAGCDAAPAGLVSWWPGDGTAADALGAHHGVMENGAGYGAGLKGEAFSFNGTGAYADMGPINVGSAWTIEGWVNASALPAGRHSVAGTEDACADWAISFDDGEFGARYAPADGSCTASVPSGLPVVAGTWYHVAAVCDGTNALVYVDGELANLAPVKPFYQAYAGGDFEVGGEYCCAGDNFPGLVDELAVYNRALTAGEIAGLYNAGAAGKCALSGQAAVTVAASPAAGGTAGGGGSYALGSAVTVTAAPSAAGRWVFEGWTEGGFLLSTNAAYTFSVFSDQQLVAEFEGATNVVTEQPAGQTVELGSSAELTAAVTSPGALRYQWYEGAAPVAGGTNATLVLRQVTLGQQGSYELVASNGYGSVTSQLAVLSVAVTAVAVTSPTNGTELTGPAGSTLSATASDAHGIQEVDYYTNGVLLGVGSGPQNSLAVAGLTGGSYAVRAVAVDGLGLSGTSAVVHVTVSNPGTTLLDFEAVDAAGGGAGGAVLSNYLARFGVRTTNTSAGAGPVVEDDRVFLGGNGVRASSGDNFLTQTGANGAVSNTLLFAQGYASVSWVRTRLVAGTAGASLPGWRAHAYDSAGNELGAVGESAQTSYTDVPAAGFTLLGPGIASIRFEGNNNGAGALNTLPLDDLLLSTLASGSLLTVSLSSGNGTELTAPGTVALAAAVGDGNGAVVTNVDFYEGVSYLGSAAPAGGVAGWTENRLAAGSYGFTAVASDTAGAARSSSPLNLTVAGVTGLSVLNFDSLNTSGGSVSGAALSNYLAGDGAGLSNVTLGTAVEAVNAGGVTVGGGAAAPSPPNYLTQAGVSGAVSFTLWFTTPVRGLGFTRAGLVAGAAGASHPQWQATLLDVNGVALGSAGEGLILSPTNVPARVFGLTGQNGAGVAAVRFDSDSLGKAAFTAVLLDDVILNTNPVAAGLSVTLTSPASGAPGLAALQPITLGAAPADTVGLVDHVSFYAGGALLGSAGRSPYEFTWTNAVAGSYALRAQVVDTNGETAYSGAVQVVVGAGADQTVVNFDGLDARGGAVTGAVLSNYLAGYGMSASNQTAGAEVAVENQGLLGKGLLVAASSPPNALTQIGAAGPVAYTVRFGRLLSGFGFTRPELLASPYASQAGWQATAYDLAGVALGQVGEGPTGSYSNVSARAFELGGPGIASVQISSEGTGLTALNAVVLDDFVLTTNAGAFPPAVVLTSPVNGLAVTGSAELTVAADAVDAVGLASVSFYTNGGLLGVAAGLPYSAGWTNPPAGSYAVTAVALNTSGLMRTSAVVSVTVLPAASQFGILTQPVSQTAAAGSSVNFTVTTTGTGAVAYQWYQNGTPLAGQTGDGLTIYPAGSGNAGTYTVTASSGGVTLTSAGAALAVIQPPVFTAQPQGQMVGPGANVTLTNAVAGDGPFSWQWRLNGAGIAGATNSSYAILAAQPLDSGAYQVVAANAVGFAVSAVAPVTVRAAVAAQTTNDDFANRISLNPLLGPVSGYNNSLATAEPGEPEHDGKPGGKSIWFTWQASFTGVISLTTLGSDFDTLLAVYTGTNVARLTPVAADDDSGGYFTSLVSFNVTAGTNYQIAVDGFNGASGNVVLGMPSGTGYRVLSVASGNSVPVIREQPVSQLAVAGSQVVLGVAATGARTYQWNFNGTPIPGATNRVLALPNFQRGAVGLYNVLVANAAGSVASEEAAVQISVVNSGNRAAAQMKFGEAADTTGGGGNAGPGPQDGGDTRGFTVSQTFSTVGATREAGEPETCGQAGGASEWYAYTAPASGTLNVSAAGSGFNTIVGVYTGTGEDFASLTEQGCDYTTNYQTHQPDVMIGGVAAGSVYYIVVDGYQGASGVVQLQIGLGQPPTVLAEPASQLATLGSNATFSVSAVGSTNLYYQWRLNGANLALATNASYTTAAAGSYTVVVSNAVGVVTSAPPAVLTAQLAPGLVTQPASQTVLAGSNVQLTVSAAGVSTPANPLLYQWYDNGAAVAGATGPVLALAPAQWTNSGSYFVVVANSYGSATSAVAVLTVQDLTPPTVTVTSPGPNAIVPASPVTVSGTAGDNVGVSLVRVRVGTNGYQTAAGTTSWSLPVALSPGTNTVTVQSQDLAGNLSVPAALTLRYQIPWPLTVLTNGTGGTTSPAGASNGAVLVIGNNYTIQAVPGNNWLFARWSAGTNAGTLTNLSSRALLSFTMSTNLVLEAGFDTNLFPSVAGASYNGLFAPGGGVTEASSGFLTLRLIGNTGAYSATLMLDGGTYPFTGGFDPLGSAQTNLNRAGKTPVAVTLSLHLNPPDGLLTGTLVGDTWSASLLAERAVFNAVTLPATNYAGKYTLAIPPGSNAPALSPDGWGYATLTATTGGNATFLGALADGTTLSRSVPVAGDGDIPFYLSLYGGRGSLQGWIMLSNQPPPTLTGELNWIKPALAGALYPLGFTNLSLAAPGSGYATPAAGGLALSLPGGATLILSNGNLAAPLVYAVGLSRANTLTNQGNSNPTNLLTGTINPATGALTVTFRATGAPTNTTARGVLLQNQTNALGSFPGAQQSGSLQLQPN